MSEREKSVSMSEGRICFFRFKKKEEQRFMIQQYSKGQALWGAPEPQPEHQPSTPRRKKKAKKVCPHFQWEGSESSYLEE